MICIFQFKPDAYVNVADCVVSFFFPLRLKVSKYGVLSGPNAGKYGPEKNSVFGHFSRSAPYWYMLLPHLPFSL